MCAGLDHWVASFSGAILVPMNMSLCGGLPINEIPRSRKFAAGDGIPPRQDAPLNAGIPFATASFGWR